MRTFTVEQQGFDRSPGGSPAKEAQGIDPRVVHYKEVTFGKHIQNVGKSEVLYGARRSRKDQQPRG